MLSLQNLDKNNPVASKQFLRKITLHMRLSFSFEIPWFFILLCLSNKIWKGCDTSLSCMIHIISLHKDFVFGFVGKSIIPHFQVDDIYHWRDHLIFSCIYIYRLLYRPNIYSDTSRSSIRRISVECRSSNDRHIDRYIGWYDNRGSPYHKIHDPNNLQQRNLSGFITIPLYSLWFLKALIKDCSLSMALTNISEMMQCCTASKTVQLYPGWLYMT